METLKNQLDALKQEMTKCNEMTNELFVELMKKAGNKIKIKDNKIENSFLSLSFVVEDEYVEVLNIRKKGDEYIVETSLQDLEWKYVSLGDRYYITQWIYEQMAHPENFE